MPISFEYKVIYIEITAPCREWETTSEFAFKLRQHVAQFFRV